ncbi:YcgL domain-containing protein [Jinshanibacter sp. LJY008]|uniref:YcgL domain-containing protein LPW36_07375 n=1 Tax=Limnobaculum eriocheiris TaxID=2897391 RepID=A0A9X1MWC6_9GAMM|nr:YcgL domain-containing protein [Limnobaculum eriocheiris]MCD1125828.1 YcgL domain-containing protein [Limnobaculum eriocheiris]
MLCAIYRSNKRDQTYLYIERRDDFSKIPEALMNSFGKPVFVMTLELEQRTKLASADIARVKQDLIGQGFYLQVPPPVESLLKTPDDVDD